MYTPIKLMLLSTLRIYNSYNMLMNYIFGKGWLKDRLKGLKVSVKLSVIVFTTIEMITGPSPLTPDWLTRSEAADSEQLYTLQTRRDTSPKPVLLPTPRPWRECTDG